MAGVDEVGVGALAGPVMAAAVVLPAEAPWFADLDDSKRLTRRTRDRLHDLIMGGAVAVGVGYATQQVVDNVGINEARRRAMIQAFKECQLILVPYDCSAVVDGKSLAWLRHDLGGKHSVFADRADSRSLSVAAASIVAKTIRDRFMELAAGQFPAYGFERHKGYGTPQHLKALATHGSCSLHRMTFEPIKSSKKAHK